MSILMPICCAECPCINYDGDDAFCNLLGPLANDSWLATVYEGHDKIESEFDIYSGRPDNCRLIEIRCKEEI